MVQQRGFSLTELLFAIAIIGVLAAIAVPSYQYYIRESRLSDAKRALITNVADLERHYAQHHRFTKNSTTWADLTITQTEHFCIKLQGEARGVKGDNFTMKAVAFDKKTEPRTIIIDDDQRLRVCETTTSDCHENKTHFTGASHRTDKQCEFL